MSEAFLQPKTKLRSRECVMLGLTVNSLRVDGFGLRGCFLKASGSRRCPDQCWTAESLLAFSAMRPALAHFAGSLDGSFRAQVPMPLSSEP